MSGDAGKTPTGGARTLWRYAPIAMVAAGLGIGYAMGWHRVLSLSYLAESREMLAAFVAAHYGRAAVLFFVAYALAVAFSFPAASALTILAGFLFGWLVGSALVVFAATLGATLLFLAARTAFSDILHRKLGARVARLADGFERDAFGYLLVLRLAPIFPFWIVNIAPAFFDVKLRTYVAATFVGILPGTIAYAWLGEGLDSVLVAAGQSGQDITLRDLVTPEITLAFVALALVAAIPTIVRKVRGRRA